MEYLRDKMRPNDGYLTESQSDNEWKRVTEVKHKYSHGEDLTYHLTYHFTARPVHHGDYPRCGLV